MKNFDKSIIIKNLTGILCGGMVLCFLLPFVSVDAKMSMMGASSSSTSSVNGFNVITEGGFLGIMLLLCPIITLVASYLPQLDKYKKVVTLIFSAASILILFIVPGQLSAQGGGEVASTDIQTTYLIGFWLMLLFAVALTAMSVIQFFNLKGNKVFEAVNISEEPQNANISDNVTSDENKGQKPKLPQMNIDKDKITDFAKNTSSTISGQIKNVAGNVSNKVSSIQKEKPEEIMEQLKKLYELKEAGILTDKEFTDKKQEMLQRM